MTDYTDFRKAVGTYVQQLFQSDSILINGMRIKIALNQYVYTLQRTDANTYSASSGLVASLKIDFTKPISIEGLDTTFDEFCSSTFCSSRAYMPCVYAGSLTMDVTKTSGFTSLIIYDMTDDQWATFLDLNQQYKDILTAYKKDVFKHDVQDFILNSANNWYTGTIQDQVPLIDTLVAEWDMGYNGDPEGHNILPNGYMPSGVTYFSNNIAFKQVDFGSLGLNLFSCPDFSVAESPCFRYDNDNRKLVQWKTYYNTTDLSMYNLPDSYIGVVVGRDSNLLTTTKLVFIIALSEDGKQAFLQRYPQYAIACCLRKMTDPMASGVCPDPGNFLTTCDAVMDVICKNNKTGACACYTDDITRCITKECQNGKAYLNQNMRTTSCPNQCMQIVDITGGQQAVDIEIQQAITGCVPQRIYKRVDSPGCPEGTGGTGSSGGGTGSFIGYDTGAMTNYSAQSLKELRSFLMSQYTKSPTDFFTAMSQNTISFVDTVTRQPFVLKSVTATEPFDSGSSQLLSNSFQGWQLVNGALRETLVLNPNGATCQLLKEDKAVLLGLSSINVSTNKILSAQSNQVTLTQLSVDDSVDTELAFAVSVTASTDPSEWGSDPAFPYNLTKGTLTTVLKGTLIVVAISPASNKIMSAARNRMLLIIISIAAACVVTALFVFFAVLHSRGFSKKLFTVPVLLAVAFSVPIVLAALNQLDTKSY